MSEEKKEPEGNFLSLKNIIKILLLMSLFIVMVQNHGFENLILIFCLVMFCLPSALVKWGRKKFESIDLAKIQQFTQHWYETNVNKQSDSSPTSMQSKTPVSEEIEADLFNIPEPPPDAYEPPCLTDDEIWGNLNNDESNNHGQH